MALKLRAFLQSDVVKAWRGGPAPAAPPVLPTNLQNAAPGDSSGDSAVGDSAGGSDAALGATSTDLFFAKKSADLTAGDKKSLERYAKAYLGAKSSETIEVDAYASIEGDKGYNQKLSEDRAKAVKDYLIGQGVPEGKVKATGHGGWDKFPGGLQQNRRATLKPPPPASGSLGMRDPKPLGGGKEKEKPQGLPPLTDKTKDKVLDEKTAPKPKPVVTKAEIVKELIDFLKKLAANQKSKDGKVTSTDKVWQADNALNQGFGGTRGPTKRGGEGGRYDPEQLAKDIIRDLPDIVPDKNVKQFREVAKDPTDKPVDLTLTDHMHEKYKAFHDEVDKLIDGIPLLPKKAKDFLKEKMDEAVKKGAEWILDKAMDEVNVPDDAKKKLKELYQERLKEIVDGKKKENN